MSRTWAQRVVLWLAWLGTHRVDGWEVVAFLHQCGAATMLPVHDLGNLACSGCGFVPGQLERECEPLYERKEKA
jgi:hypothetical protein